LTILSHAAIRDCGNSDGSTPYDRQPPTPSATPEHHRLENQNEFNLLHWQQNEVIFNFHNKIKHNNVDTSDNITSLQRTASSQLDSSSKFGQAV
jgi:hypothetical protein